MLARKTKSPAKKGLFEKFSKLITKMGGRLGTPISYNYFRRKISEPYLRGLGVEIGAGANPQELPENVRCEYFDKRNEEELGDLFNVNIAGMMKVFPIDTLKERFPNGADFLIAHNVLEHSPDLIRTLIGWYDFVKDGGIFVISVPDAESCPDKDRCYHDIEHILLDYFLERDADSSESREHIYSFIMGWIDEGYYKGRDKFEVAKMAHWCAQVYAINKIKNDLHWHSFNNELFRKVLAVSAFLSNKDIKIEKTASPYTSELKTVGDIIYVFRIFNRPEKNGYLYEIERSKKDFINVLKKLSSIAGDC